MTEPNTLGMCPDCGTVCGNLWHAAALSVVPVGPALDEGGMYHQALDADGQATAIRHSGTRPDCAACAPVGEAREAAAVTDEELREALHNTSSGHDVERAVRALFERPPTPSAAFVDVTFDGPPSHESGRFIECEGPDGRSVNAGQWIDRGDGTWALRIALAPSAESVAVTEAMVEAVWRALPGYGAPDMADVRDALAAALSPTNDPVR